MKNIFTLCLMICFLITGCVNETVSKPQDPALQQIKIVDAKTIIKSAKNKQLIQTLNIVEDTSVSKSFLVNPKLAENHSSNKLLLNPIESIENSVEKPLLPPAQNIKKTTLNNMESPKLLLQSTDIVKTDKGDNKHSLPIQQMTQPEYNKTSDNEKITSVDNGATIQKVIENKQLNEFLAQIVEMSLPNTLNLTVRDGMEYVLQHTGFKLCNNQADVLFNSNLQLHHYKLGPDSLGHILNILSGPDWKTTVDLNSKTICFQK